MVQVYVSDVEIKIFGTLLYRYDIRHRKAGEPNIACLVTLRRGAEVIKTTSTDKNGYFEFILDATLPENYADYSVEFRGSGALEYYNTEIRNEKRGDWENVRVDSGVPLPQPPIIPNIAAASVTISEKIIVVGLKIDSIANIFISNIDLQQGNIELVTIEHKLSLETEYSHSGTFNVNWNSENNSGKFEIAGMSWSSAGVSHDFRITFKDADGNSATDGSGAIIEMIVNGIVFDGVQDLPDYPEVTGLMVTNATDSQVGSFSQPNLIPADGIARLEWNDMREKSDEVNFPLVNGDVTDITSEQFLAIRGYMVFLYIGATAAPEYQRPTATDINGNWYFIKETQDTYAELSVPKDKVLGFYVCCRTGISGGSVLDNIPTLNYGDI